MTFLSREEFLKPVARKEEIVDVPELGEGAQVRVVGFSAGERQEFESQFTDKKGKQIPGRNKQFRQRLLLATLRDENDMPLLTAEDFDAISNQSAIVIERIVDVALRLCGLSGNDIEEAEKN